MGGNVIGVVNDPSPLSTVGVFSQPEMEAAVRKSEWPVLYNPWNPLDKGGYITLSNGLLTATQSGVTTWNAVRALAPVSSGKCYWEVLIGNGMDGYHMVGVARASASLDSYASSSSGGWEYYATNGAKVNSGNQTAYGDIFTTGDVIGVAIDADVGKIWFSKNGVWQASGDPAAGTNYAFTGASGPFYPCASPYTVGVSITLRTTVASQSYAAPSGFPTFG